MAKARLLAWTDLEMTGTDRHLDWILEIGVVITHVAYPCEEIDCYTAVILPEDPHWSDRMNDFVVDMHTSNGLLSDIESHGQPLREVEQEVLRVLMKHGRPNEYMLAGSGCSHADRPFIETQMPGLNKWLQKPALDVGTLRRALRFAGRGDLDAFGQTFADGNQAHRGLADVRDHLNEWRQYASMFQTLPQET
jgi:oligoribonuclease